MKNWMDEFISRCLADVPPGTYRTRAEKELRDHMESQCQVLVEAGESHRDAHLAVWNIMGDPEQLRTEYKATWERSLQGRLERVKACAGTWAAGLAVMGGVHFLVSWIISCVWNAALSLPGDSSDPWIRMIRGTLGDLNNSLFWRHLFPFALALTAGARYLGRRFQTSCRPAWLISTALSFHWAYITAFNVWWEALDDHRTFWEELMGYLTYRPTVIYWSLTFALCILLGALFGRKRERKLAA